MGNWQDYLGEFYEPLEVLKEEAEKKITLLYDRQGRQLCIMKQQPLEAMAVYKSLMSLENLHIPRIFHVFSEGGQCVTLEEHIVGTSLSHRLDMGGQLPEESIEDILRQLCQGLQALHARGIIHRDIKPSNLLMTNDGILKLIDFGIARIQKAEKGRDTVCFGTRGYAPPEQYGFGQTDERSDIFSLGMTIGMFLPQSEKLRQIVEKSTRFAPKDRYASVTEILGELQGAGTYNEGLAGWLYRKLGQFSLPFYPLKKVDAKAVEEMLAGKILSFCPPMPVPRKDYALWPEHCTLEPWPYCREDDQYIFSSQEEARQAGLGAFEEYVYSRRAVCVHEALVLFRKQQMRHYLAYEIVKENYYHRVDRMVEGRIRELMDWGRRRGGISGEVPPALMEFSCEPSFQKTGEQGSHLWRLEHFEDMSYTEHIYELLDKWSGAVPPVLGYERYIRTVSRLIGLAENEKGELAQPGEKYELCYVDLYAFRIDEAARQLQKDVLYALAEVVDHSDELRQDIQGAIKEAYGERLTSALKKKAEEIRAYFRLCLGR